MQSMLRYCFGLPDVFYEAGSVLITEGEACGPLFVLAEGCVSVRRDDIEVARIDTPGAVFGETSALLDVPHTATVKAVTKVRVHIIENAMQFIEARPKIAIGLAALLAGRLVSATNHLVKAKRLSAGQAGPIRDIAETAEAIMHGHLDAAPSIDPTG